jgi:hypothetical protein
MLPLLGFCNAAADEIMRAIRFLGEWLNREAVLFQKICGCLNGRDVVLVVKATAKRFRHLYRSNMIFHMMRFNTGQTGSGQGTVDPAWWPCRPCEEGWHGRRAPLLPSLPPRRTCSASCGRTWPSIEHLDLVEFSHTASASGSLSPLTLCGSMRLSSRLADRRLQFARERQSSVARGAPCFGVPVSFYL